jgi:hypothetical protein
MTFIFVCLACLTPERQRDYGGRVLGANHGIRLYRTSRGGPRFKLDYPLVHSLLKLAPARDLWGLNLADFIPAYRAQLDAVGVAAIRKDLAKITSKAPGKEPVLLCFEDIRKPEQWCHRRVFADWWAEQTGEVVDELPEQPVEAKPVSSKAKAAAAQASLFPREDPAKTKARKIASEITDPGLRDLAEDFISGWGEG